MAPISSRTLGVGLAVWSGGFALVHLAWALGWRGGVPTDQPPIATRPFFLVYDLAAAAAMIAAAIGALVLAYGRVSRALIVITVVASILALLRGVPGLIVDAVTHNTSVVGVGADIWFVTAGTAGLVLARLSRTAAISGSPAQRRTRRT